MAGFDNAAKRITIAIASNINNDAVNSEALMEPLPPTPRYQPLGAHTACLCGTGQPHTVAR